MNDYVKKERKYDTLPLGGAQVRTGDQGFAILCLTTWLHRLTSLNGRSYCSYCAVFFYVVVHTFLIGSCFYTVKKNDKVKTPDTNRENGLGPTGLEPMTLCL